MASAGSILMTGASGFLGRSVLRELMQKGPPGRTHLLAHSASSRERTLRFLSDQNDRRLVSFVDGDLALIGLGLSPEIQAIMRDEVEEIWHIAAITDLEPQDPKPLYDTNIGGTAALLDFARGLRHLRRFHFVSSAYVAGATSSRIPERQLSNRPNFRNIYELTKYTAERLVLGSGLPAVVYRPSIIIGDSITGDAGDDCQTIYQFVRAVLAGLTRTSGSSYSFARTSMLDARPRFDFRIPGSPRTTMNFVCVDEVAHLMVTLSRRAQPGQVFNLTNPTDLSGDELRMALETVLNIRGMTLGGAVFEGPTPGERLTLRLARPFLPYIMEPGPVWETSGGRALARGNWLPDISVEKFAHLLAAHLERQVLAA